MGEGFLVTRAKGAAEKCKVFWLPPGGGEECSTNFIRGGSAPGSAPLPLYVPFLTVKARGGGYSHI